jgi:hypothetical protein
MEDQPDLVLEVIASRARRAAQATLGFPEQPGQLLQRPEDLPKVDSNVSMSMTPQGNLEAQAAREQVMAKYQSAATEAYLAGVDAQVPYSEGKLQRDRQATQVAMDRFSPQELLGLNMSDAVAQVMATLQMDNTSEEAVKAFLNQPISRVEDVFKLIHTYNKSITNRAFKVMAVQINEAFQHLQVNQQRLSAELKWLGGDCRQMQIEASRLQVLVHGFTSAVSPQERNDWIYTRILEVEEIDETICWRARIRANEKPAKEDCMHILQGDPITVQQGEGRWSAITVVTFTDFKVRRALCQHFQNQELRYNFNDKVLKVALKPAAPRFQRKLEGVLRALLGVISRHPDSKGLTATVIWPTLTLLAPQEKVEWTQNHEAWATVKYEEDVTGLKVGVYVSQELHKLMSHLEDPSKEGETLWYHEWYRQFWKGVQNDLDESENIVAQSLPKFSKRWSEVMLGGASAKDGFPLPITITLCEPGEIAYNQADYDYKMGRVSTSSTRVESKSQEWTAEEWEQWNKQLAAGSTSAAGSQGAASGSEQVLKGGTGGGATQIPQYHQQGDPAAFSKTGGPPVPPYKKSPSPGRQGPY